MNIKSAIIKTIDWLIYLALAFILLIGLITAFAMGQPFQAGLFILFGWLLVAMLGGFWFALSSLVDNTARQVLLQEQQNKLIEKLKPSIISTWLDKYAVKANWDKEELRSNPSDLFAHMNNPDNSLLTQAFLEAFVENLSAANCTYLTQILNPKPTEKTSNVK